MTVGGPAPETESSGSTGGGPNCCAPGGSAPSAVGDPARRDNLAGTDPSGRATAESALSPASSGEISAYAGNGPADRSPPHPALPNAAPPDPASVPEPVPSDVPVPGTAGRPLVPRWCGILLILLGLCTVPWIAGLAVELPNRVQTPHYAFSWAGFDVLLASLLLWTGWGAVRNSEEIGVSAAVTAGLLVVDAWFDVTSASTTGQLLAALAMAAFVELPLATFCLWLSGRAESARRRRTARMIAMVGRLWQYRSRALRRVRPGPERRPVPERR